MGAGGPRAAFLLTAFLSGADVARVRGSADRTRLFALGDAGALSRPANCACVAAKIQHAFAAFRAADFLILDHTK